MSDSQKRHAVSGTNGRGSRCTLDWKSLEPQLTLSHLRFADGPLLYGNTITFMPPKARDP